MQRLKSAGVQRCQSQSRSELDQVVIPWNWSKYRNQFTRNGSLVVFSCFRKSKEATGIEHGLREELILSPRIRFENYPSRKAFGVFRLILSDSHSSTFSDLINQWLLWKLCYTLRKKKETKLTKKRLSLWHGWSLCWTFKHRRQPKTE